MFLFCLLLLGQINIFFLCVFIAVDGHKLPGEDVLDVLLSLQRHWGVVCISFHFSTVTLLDE